MSSRSADVSVVSCDIKIELFLIDHGEEQSRVRGHPCEYLTRAVKRKAG